MKIRPVTRERWGYAQRKQRQAQARKAARLGGDMAETIAWATEHSRTLAAALVSRGVIVGPDDRVVEVGSGAHGLIWRWPTGRRIAVDPLAVFYAAEFAALQHGSGVDIVAARGEELPLADGSCKLVLSDNVIDHAADPARFLAECRRVVAPDGWLYLTVHVHHPIYAAGARTYNALHRLGVELDLPAFPNHPFHFTEREALQLIEGAGFAIADSDWVDAPRRVRPGRPLDHLRRVFPKDATLIAVCRPR